MSSLTVVEVRDIPLSTFSPQTRYFEDFFLPLLAIRKHPLYIVFYVHRFLSAISSVQTLFLKNGYVDSIL